jgi:hypothetical protein
LCTTRRRAQANARTSRLRAGAGPPREASSDAFHGPIIYYLKDSTGTSAAKVSNPLRAKSCASSKSRAQFCTHTEACFEPTNPTCALVSLTLTAFVCSSGGGWLGQASIGCPVSFGFSPGGGDIATTGSRKVSACCNTICACVCVNGLNVTICNCKCAGGTAEHDWMCKCSCNVSVYARHESAHPQLPKLEVKPAVESVPPTLFLGTPC